MFITLFLIIFISTMEIGNNCIRFEESKISQHFHFSLSQLHNFFFSHEQIFGDFGYVILCILSCRCCEFHFSFFFHVRASFWLILPAFIGQICKLKSNSYSPHRFPLRRVGSTAGLQPEQQRQRCQQSHCKGGRVMSVQANDAVHTFLLKLFIQRNQPKTIHIESNLKI